MDIEKKEEVLRIDVFMSYLEYFQNLLENSIIDYSMLKIICEQTNSCSQKEEQSVMEILVKILVPTLTNKFLLFNAHHDKKELILLQKSIEALLLIVYNINSASKIKILFNSENHLLINSFKQIVTFYKAKQDENFITELILTICFDEYKKKFIEFQNKEIEELYCYFFSELFSVHPEPVKSLPLNKVFHKFMDDLYILDLNKANLPKVSKDTFFLNNILESMIVLGLLKDKYASSKDHIFKLTTFLEHIIDDHISVTKKQFGNEYTSLFRRDDFCHQTIKYLFFCFGNPSFIESFLGPLLDYVDKFEEYFTKNNQNIDIKEVFTSFMNDVIANLNDIPYILKVILKISYAEIKKNYSNFPENNYSPVFILLILNFLINPKLQNLYNLMTKYKSIRYINRIIRNICFNQTFDENSDLLEFNSLISKLHININNFIKQSIIDKIDLTKEEEINETLGNLLYNDKMKIPLFYYEFKWKILSSFFELNKEVIPFYVVSSTSKK